MKARWMTGGSAVSAAPAEWLTALGEPSDLDLLALAGQFTALALRRVPGGPVTERPLLPQLSLPQMPCPARTLFVRAIAQRPANSIAIVTLVAARGQVVSPLDWMPGVSATGIPGVYGPWLDWLTESSDQGEATAPTADTWDDWPPFARFAALDALRRSQPAEARARIAAIAPTVAAEQRLRLVALLAVGLDRADADALAGFSDDRSGKVKALAGNLLARLGRGHPDAATVGELADFFEKGRAGLLSRRTVVSARKLKSAAQKARRVELAGMVPLAALAGALDLQTGALIDAWTGGDGTDELVAMTAATGSESDAERLADRLVRDAATIPLATPLFDRLDRDARLRLGALMVELDQPGFGATIACLGPDLGALAAGPLGRSAAVARIRAVPVRFESQAGIPMSPEF